MATYIIKGGNKLNGTVKISGNKNAVFPCIAAALLTSQKVTLRNVPKIDDVRITIEILKKLGITTEFKNDSLLIEAKKINTNQLPSELMRKLRGSIVLAGAILGRNGKVKFSFPGGDIVGKRPIETHLRGFQGLGFSVQIRDLNYSVSGSIKKNVQIFLDEASVTATENLILSSVISKFEVTLKNCAQEPHVIDLCQMLNKMGADISGIGSSILRIKGVKKLSRVDFRLSADYLEMGTYAIAASITHGRIEFKNCNLQNLEPVIYPLNKMGVVLEKRGTSIYGYSKKIYANPKLHTNIWPGFPTDLMSTFIVLATQAKGVSLMHDWMYESRMFFVDKLINMGANITIADPHRVLIYGPTKLTGRKLETPDIRAGMALVLAALVARGESTINKAELIDRGYEDVAGKLSSLGADIKRLD